MLLPKDQEKLQKTIFLTKKLEQAVENLVRWAGLPLIEPTIRAEIVMTAAELINHLQEVPPPKEKIVGVIDGQPVTMDGAGITRILKEAHVQVPQVKRELLHPRRPVWLDDAVERLAEGGQALGSGEGLQSYNTSDDVESEKL